MNTRRFELGVHAYLTKPVKANDLYLLLNKLIRGQTRD